MPCFRWLVTPDNFNCCRAIGSKNTLNLKIIDQIYCFRYAYCKTSKEPETIAIKIEVHRQSLNPFIRQLTLQYEKCLTDVDRPYTSSRYFPLLSTSTGSEYRGILLKIDKLELHSSKLGAI